jgi:hypothetical protein
MSERAGRSRVGHGMPGPGPLRPGPDGRGNSGPELELSQGVGLSRLRLCKVRAPGEAEKLIAEAPILHPNRLGAQQFAVVFAGFGDRDHTIERLERLARAGPVRLGFTLNSPEFAFVRDDPRVKALRKKVGLPE